MPDQPPAAPPWAEQLAAAVGQRVAHYRNKRGLTGQQLSDALGEIGLDLKRTVLGNLESGYRRTVTVAEVFGLAYVLGVPPLLLLAPIGADGEFEVLPGRPADPWSSARWITGEGRVPGERPPAVIDDLWRTNVDLVQLYRDHTAHESDWRGQTRLTGDETPEEREQLFERADRRRGEIEQSLRLIRRAIRDRGDAPPPLPPELAHVDD